MNADVNPGALFDVDGIVPFAHHSLYLRVFPVLDPEEFTPYSYFVHVDSFANVQAYVPRDCILVAHPEGVRVNFILLGFLSFSWIK